MSDIRYHSSDDMSGLGELSEVMEPVAVVLRPDGSVDAYGFIGIVDQRQATQPQTVYVLHYSHRHGDDITVHADSDLAHEWLASIVREWWTEITGRGDGVPDSPDGLTNEKAVSVYFDHKHDESWSIKPCTVQGR